MRATVTILLILLLAARLYHPETIDSIARSTHTHVAVSGTVTLIRHEADGDVHLRLSDGHGHWIVGEIIPLIPLPLPQRGQRITVRGIRRFDNERGHRWTEVHPVESWTAEP